MKKNVPTKTEDKNKEKVMNDQKTNHSCSSRCLLVRMTLAALAVLALGSIPVARAGEY